MQKLYHRQHFYIPFMYVARKLIKNGLKVDNFGGIKYDIPLSDIFERSLTFLFLNSLTNFWLYFFIKTSLLIYDYMNN